MAFNRRGRSSFGAFVRTPFGAFGDDDSLVVNDISNHKIWFISKSSLKVQGSTAWPSSLVSKAASIKGCGYDGKNIFLSYEVPSNLTSSDNIVYVLSKDGGDIVSQFTPPGNSAIPGDPNDPSSALAMQYGVGGIGCLGTTDNILLHYRSYQSANRTISASRAEWSGGTATLTLLSDPFFSVGMTIIVSGFSSFPGYNGSFAITNKTAPLFTVSYSVANPGGTDTSTGFIRPTYPPTSLEYGMISILSKNGSLVSNTIDSSPLTINTEILLNGSDNFIYAATISPSVYYKYSSSILYLSTETLTGIPPANNAGLTGNDSYVYVLFANKKICKVDTNTGLIVKTSDVLTGVGTVRGIGGGNK